MWNTAKLRFTVMQRRDADGWENRTLRSAVFLGKASSMTAGVWPAATFTSAEEERNAGVELAFYLFFSPRS